MFYKLMFLEVGQGYPQSAGKSHTSSVSAEGSDPVGVLLMVLLHHLGLTAPGLCCQTSLRPAVLMMSYACNILVGSWVSTSVL